MSNEQKPPEKIYLQNEGDGYDPQDWEGASWCADRIDDTDVEYIRADLAPRVSTEEAKPLDLEPILFFMNTARPTPFNLANFSLQARTHIAGLIAEVRRLRALASLGNPPNLEDDSRSDQELVDTLENTALKLGAEGGELGSEEELLGDKLAILNRLKALRNPAALGNPPAPQAVPEGATGARLAYEAAEAITKNEGKAIRILPDSPTPGGQAKDLEAEEIPRLRIRLLTALAPFFQGKFSDYHVYRAADAAIESITNPHRENV